MQIVKHAIRYLSGQGVGCKVVEIKRDERANSPRQKERERENRKVSRSIPFLFFLAYENNSNSIVL